jgi:tetratricopeptide (TPR) repeat protein
MIGSAADKKAILIEVSPDSFGVYEVPNTKNQLLCSNHFQSTELKDNKRNREQILNSHSKYRMDKMIQLMDENSKINPNIAADILRNKEGLNNLPIGYGNEKALNQMLAHHGVIFKPEQLLVWVSSNPYQLGEFVCYDLNTIFNNHNFNIDKSTLQKEELSISKDPFLDSEAYKNYEMFRVEDRKMDAVLENNSIIDSSFVKKYQSLNPDFWLVYCKMGLYFYKQKNYREAKINFEKAITKEITTLPSKQKIEKYLKKINRKLQ